MENAYTKRLESLRENRIKDNVRRILPHVNPRQGREILEKVIGPITPPPVDEGPKVDETSMFSMNVNKFKEQDSRFGNFMDQYTKMAEGLRQEVQQGYMPMPIAQQRLKQFVEDSRNHFSQNAATPMDNPQVAQAIDGLMGQAMQGQLPEQQAQQQAQQPAQAMTPQGGM